MNPSIYKSLLKLTSDELLAKAKKLVQQERVILVEILHHLLMINDKKLYLQMGFKSLFDFCTKELGYSESAAYRRIQAMKLLKEVPEVKQKVLSGGVNLTHLAQVQKVATVERKQNNNVISKAQKIKLLEKVENKTTRQSETILREFSPLSAIKNDSKRVINNTQTEIKFIADQELLNKIEELKNLLSHKHVNPNMNELLHTLTDLALCEVRRRKKIMNKEESKRPKRNHNKITSAPKKPCGKLKYRNQRYIHPTVKNEVWFRDGGCCSYRDPQTKRKCESKFQLEFDHIKPVAIGGDSDINNLRLLCREHNQYMAYKNNLIKNKFFKLGNS
ncbi:MAG: HNH endonuclease [Bdellovibrionales bacterium]|nr:HNH endonuclease [Bdellovibrionales bacterium]